MFFCVTAPVEGGETPIADVRRAFHTSRKRYVTVSRRMVGCWLEILVRAMGFHGKRHSKLRTKKRLTSTVSRVVFKLSGFLESSSGQAERRSAVRKHPVTGELVWFNHATFFHVSTLAPEIRAGLQAELAEEDLPYNTYYGDGSQIEPEVLDILRDAYRQETIKFPWQEHDLLLLDNMLAAHGRSAFQGPRKIVVGMTEPYSGD